jgi:hypothetical protein
MIDPPRHCPAPGSSPERWLEQLRELGEELRATFAEERRAIGALDHARLTYLAVHKQHLAERLAEARTTAPVVDAPVVRALFSALRVEAHANAMLATAATEAVRAMLGYQTTGGYDRSARRTTIPMQSILATY